MNAPIVDSKLLATKNQLSLVLTDLQTFATKLKNQSLQSTIADLIKNIQEPFLFVVVGEVKAGKSSFINALLQANVCQTDAEPCTDKIQQITYAPQQFNRSIDRDLQQIGLPIEILKNLSIVDTPGTNTIIDNHQAITKQFIPNSDLIFFVFFAKNPYTRSAWDLLDYVNQEWRKKVIFVLQQADLTKPEELAKNKTKLQELAQQKGIDSPKIFVTSAELEFNGDLENSGFETIRNFIYHTLGKDGANQLKLQAIATTTTRLIEKLKQDFFVLQQQLEIDKNTVKIIKTKLNRNKQQSSFELESLIARLLETYDQITERVKREFRQKLTFGSLIQGSFTALFNRDKPVPGWMEELKENCETELKLFLSEISQDGIQHFVEGIRQLLHNLVTDLQNIKINRVDRESIAIKIIDRRQDVIEEVQTKVSHLMSDRNFLTNIESINASVAPDFIGGGAITIAGTAITTITQVVLLDILGAAFAGIGILFAGGSLFLKKRQIINQFETKLNQERTRFRNELSNKLNSKLDLIYEEIDRSFIEIYNYVAQEETDILPLVEDLQTIEANAEKTFKLI